MATYNGGSVIAHIGADASDYFKAMSAVGSVTGKTMGGASSATQGATGKFSLMNTAVGKIAVGVGAVALVSKGIGVLKDSVGSAVARFDTLNQYPKVMKQMGYSTQDTNKSVGILKKGVDGLPTSLQDLTKSAQSFAILTGSATEGAKSATALNDAFLASGASAGDASRGVEQYSQMLASGKVDLQSWKTLQETMPYALTAVAKSFGLTGKSAQRDLYAKLQSGEITVDQLNDRFVKLDGGVNGFATTARKATGGIGTSFTNMRNAVTNGMANMLTSIDNGLKQAGTGGIAAIFDSAKLSIIASFKVINSTVQASMPIIVGVFKTLYTAISGVVNFVKANSNWLAPLVVGVGTFTTLVIAINALSKAFTVLKVAMAVGSNFQLLGFALQNMANESKLAQIGLTLYSAAARVAAGVQAAFNAVMAINPFILIIAAITAVVAALVWWTTQTKTGQAVWQAVITFLQTAWTATAAFLSGIWNSLSGIFSTIWQALVPVIQNLVTMLQSIWTGYVTAATAVWNGLVSIASGVWNLLKSVILGPILLLIDLLTGNWSQMKKDAVMIWNNIKSSLGQIVSGIVTAVSGYFKGLGQMLSGIWNGVKGAASSIWNAISSTLRNLANSAISGVKGAWSGITGWASSVWNGVKSAIRAAMNFDLVAAGRAIMDSFFSGLVSAWGKVKSFVGGIASWIRKHKGPISYDRKLLIPAGAAIMGGFGSSLNANFADVKKSVSSYAGQIADEFGQQKYVASAQLTANSTGVAGQINGGLASLSDEVAEQSAQTPVYEIHNEMVGDKITTTVNSKNARRQATTRLVTGGI